MPCALGALGSGLTGQGWSGKASWETWLLESVSWEVPFEGEESKEKGTELHALENHTLFSTPRRKGLHANECICIYATICEIHGLVRSALLQN